MLSWATYKRAALEYSRMRPRELVVELVPTPGSRVIALPEDVLGVIAVDYGVELTLAEAQTSQSETRGWAATDAELVLTPPPATADPVTVLYYARHLPNEAEQTFPTIPVAHIALVDDLELALSLEAQADEISSGPLRYAIGQTEINREKAPDDLRERAAQLRKRVIDLLDEPVAIWR